MGNRFYGKYRLETPDPVKMMLEQQRQQALQDKQYSPDYELSPEETTMQYELLGMNIALIRNGYQSQSHKSYTQDMWDLGNETLHGDLEVAQRKAELILNSLSGNSEQEADQASSTVLDMQGKESPGPLTPLASQKSDLPLSTGQPLPEYLRTFFENRFQYDFSGVKVHDTPHDHFIAESHNARALTHGTSIVFNQNEYQPWTRSGKEILAHELAHTVQQSKAGRTVVQRKEKDDSPYVVNTGDVSLVVTGVNAKKEKGKGLKEFDIYGDENKGYIFYVNPPAFIAHADVQIISNISKPANLIYYDSKVWQEEKLKIWEIGFIQNVISHKTKVKFKKTGKDETNINTQYIDGDLDSQPWFEKASFMTPSSFGNFVIPISDIPTSYIPLFVKRKTGLFSSIVDTPTSYVRDTSFCTWLAAQNLQTGEMHYLWHILWNVSIVVWNLRVEKGRVYHDMKYLTDIHITENAFGRGSYVPKLSGKPANEVLG